MPKFVQLNVTVNNISLSKKKRKKIEKEDNANCEGIFTKI